jgi:hypothetical protein
MEIRKHSHIDHKTAIIIHPPIEIVEIAGKMFSRWIQKNFLKYITENFEFEKMKE